MATEHDAGPAIEAGHLERFAKTRYRTRIDRAMVELGCQTEAESSGSMGR